MLIVTYWYMSGSSPMIFAVLSALDNSFLVCMFNGIEVKVLSSEGWLMIYRYLEPILCKPADFCFPSPLLTGFESLF